SRAERASAGEAGGNSQSRATASAEASDAPEARLNSTVSARTRHSPAITNRARAERSPSIARVFIRPIWPAAAYSVTSRSVLDAVAVERNGKVVDRARRARPEAEQILPVHADKRLGLARGRRGERGMGKGI